MLTLNEWSEGVHESDRRVFMKRDKLKCVPLTDRKYGWIVLCIGEADPDIDSTEHSVHKYSTPQLLANLSLFIIIFSFYHFYVDK